MLQQTKQILHPLGAHQSSMSPASPPMWCSPMGGNSELKSCSRSVHIILGNDGRYCNFYLNIWKNAQTCLTLCDPMDCNPPASSVHGISLARILECVAISLSRIFLTQGSNPCVLHCRWILYPWATREGPIPSSHYRVLSWKSLATVAILNCIYLKWFFFVVVVVSY